MSFFFCTLGFLQTHAADLGMAADSINSNNIKLHQLNLKLSSTSLGKREHLSQSVAPIHTTHDATLPPHEAEWDSLNCPQFS